MEKTPLDHAIKIVGAKKLADALGVTYQSFYKWQKINRLPLTELSGETSYAEKIEAATGGQVTRQALLDWSFPNRVVINVQDGTSGGGLPLTITQNPTTSRLPVEAQNVS